MAIVGPDLVAAAIDEMPVALAPAGEGLTAAGARETRVVAVDLVTGLDLFCLISVEEALVLPVPAVVLSCLRVDVRMHH